MNHRIHDSRVGRDRVREMLAILQLGLCGRCGRARYATRRTARHAARIAAPGTRLRAYRCGEAWHLTAPPGRPQFIAPPVTVPDVGLDLPGQDKRRYRARRSLRSGGYRTSKRGQVESVTGTRAERR